MLSFVTNRWNLIAMPSPLNLFPIDQVETVIDHCAVAGRNIVLYLSIYTCI